MATIRLILFVAIPLLVCSCAVMKRSAPEPGMYESAKVHMMGTIKLVLADSTFTMSERAGLLYTEGTWRWSTTESRIYLTSRSGAQFNGKGPIYFTLNNEPLTIKGKRKLVYRNVVLSRHTD